MSDMAVLSPHQFTVTEYHRMAEHGVLEDARVELLDGLIVEMSPIGPLHWNMHAIINAYLTEALRGVASVIPQGSFPLGKKSEPQPDIAIIEPVDRAALNRTPSPGQIFGMIEIADASLAKDTGPKVRLYGRFGIADYLVVDLAANVLLHYTEPHALGYRRSERLTHGCSFRLARLPNYTLDATAFLQP
jgi:Uma2 family endonuclease